MRKPTIIAAVISAIALITAALIGIYPSLRNHKTDTAIAGIVVDQDTNQGVSEPLDARALRASRYLPVSPGGECV
jgi:hypothetical protein